jgi:hypothetical protein
MMEAVTMSETSVSFYKTTHCNNPEDSHVQWVFCVSADLWSTTDNIMFKSNWTEITQILLFHQWILITNVPLWVFLSYKGVYDDTTFRYKYDNDLTKVGRNC